MKYFVRLSPKESNKYAQKQIHRQYNSIFLSRLFAFVNCSAMNVNADENGK